MSNILRFFFIHILGVFFTYASAATAETIGKSYCEKQENLDQKYIFNGYSFLIHSYDEGDCRVVEIKNEDKTFFQAGDFGNHFYFNLKMKENRFEPIKFGRNSERIIIPVLSWNGGAHCCYRLDLFELDHEIKRIFTIESGNSIPYLEDLDHDGYVEIIVMDDFLANAFGSYSETEFSKVILRYDGNSFILADELMYLSPPDETRIKEMVKNWNNKQAETIGTDKIPRAMIKDMNTLIFSGHFQLAIDVVSRYWDQQSKQKSKFLKNYYLALKNSKFFPQLKNFINQPL